MVSGPTRIVVVVVVAVEALAGWVSASSSFSVAVSFAVSVVLGDPVREINFTNFTHC